MSSSSTTFINPFSSTSSHEDPNHSSTNSTSPQQSTPLALPAAADTTAQQLDVSQESGQTVKLDTLGPMVVNVDGTLSRISNWEKMTELERQNTVRVIGKRNRERLARLKAEEEGRGKEEL